MRNMQISGLNGGNQMAAAGTNFQPKLFTNHLTGLSQLFRPLFKKTNPNAEAYNDHNNCFKAK